MIDNVAGHLKVGTFPITGEFVPAGIGQQKVLLRSSFHPFVAFKFPQLALSICLDLRP
jgi:hypothetical protein